MNVYIKRERQGWFGRLGDAFKGVIAGVVLLIVALGLQFWNEGRTLRRAVAIDEVRAGVESVSATPSASFNGRLVHVSGEAAASGPIADEEFGVNVSALALRRRVEMYQWQEKRDRKEVTRLGGTKETITEYRYEGHWNDDEVDSSRFEKPHPNPGPLPYEGRTVHAEQVHLGGFALAPQIAQEIGGWKAVPPSQIALPLNLAASFRAGDKWFVTSEDPDKPQIGDVRVRFELVPAGIISVIARQQDGRLVAHTDAQGDEFVLVERDTQTAAQMLDAAGSRNSGLAWALRVAGFVVAWIGFGLLFKPLTVAADFIPMFGRVAGFGAAVLTAALAALWSLIGIGSGWLWYRPWALALIVLALVAGGVWLWQRTRRPALGAAAMPPAPPSSPPPPPPPPPPPA